jgi:hypothetical protein
MSLKKSRAWVLILAFYLVGSGVWFYMMPHGFPPGSPHWWANTILPIVTALVSLVGIVALVLRKVGLAQPILLAVPVTWTTSLLVACALFPVSSQQFSIPVLLLAVVFWLAYWKQSPSRALRSWGMIAAGVLAIAVGIGLPFTQQSPEADTRPLNEIPPTREGVLVVRTSENLVKLGDTIEMSPPNAYARVKCGNVEVYVRPLLTFVSRSPDRCWSSLAPAMYRERSERRFVGRVKEGEPPIYLYRDEANHWLRVAALESSRGAAIESFTQLLQPVYSHLNTYSIVEIDGHKNLALSFSPCPQVKVEVEAADYPIGRPARFAYLDAAGMFHVAEATSGEKGPFNVLASGKMSPTDELRIGLHDEGKLVSTLVLQDWAAQLSTSLSPTAGWGVPMNAIEFHREGEAEKLPCFIWVTLAATSVGRGWDSVGHREGTYRNRLRIEVEAAPEPPKKP